MSTFIEDVRNARVSPPTGRGFDPSLWTDVKNDSARDDVDRKFAAAALFFSSQLEEVRRRSGARFFALADSSNEVIRLILGFQNRDFRRIQNLTDSARQNAAGPAYLESLMAAEVEDDVRGTSLVDDSLGVDAASMVVRYLSGSSEDQRQQSTVNSGGDLDVEIKELIHLAKIYSYFEELWSECLWADAEFNSDAAPPVLKLRQSDWGKRTAVSEYRVHSVRIEQTLLAAERWKSAAQQPLGRDWINPKVTLRASGELLHTEVEEVPLPAGQLPMDVIHVEVYQRYYSESLLKQRLPDFANVTIGDMLVARRILATLGNTLQDRLLSEPSLPTRELLLHAAPLISCNSLQMALHTALRHLSAKAIKALLSSFIFGGKEPDSRSLWYRPLIRLQGDCLIALAQPLVGHNLERDIDSWSSQGGLYTLKGTQFESRLRAEMAGIAESGRIGNARVHKDPIKRLKTSKDACGDIDLLINLGRTILVGEVKCQRFPARAIEIYNNISELKEACQQAARKAKAVVASLAEVLRITAFGSLSNKQTWRVLPFVLSNQEIGVGSSFDDIPIVDRQILESYFGQGGYYPAARLGPRGTIIDKGQFHSYYDNDKEAEERIEDYLRNPPPVRRYEPFCELRQIPFEQLEDLIVVESVGLNLAKVNASIAEASA